MNSAEEVIQNLATKILSGSQKALSNDYITVVVHNPLGWHRTEFASILINSSNAYVTFANGTQVPSQVNPVAPFSTDKGMLPSSC